MRRAVLVPGVASILIGAGTVNGTSSAAPGTTAPDATTHPAARTAAAATPANWPAYHGNRARTGLYRGMPVPTGTPRVITRNLDAAVYASPLVIGGRIVVATENNSLYAFTTRGVLIWHRRLGAPARLSEFPCGNIDPSGITGTPVYSPHMRMAYVVAEFGSPVRKSMYAFDVRTGAIRWKRALGLPGTSQDAMQQRGALTLAGGRVWVTFGGRAGDCGNYKGRLVGIPMSGSGTSVSFTVPTAREAGMWTPPGPTVDSSVRIYTSVGNGASLVGDPYDFSDSVLKFDTRARLLSSFSPTSWASDNAADLDLGSQGPAVIGPWVFIAGKSGMAYTLRRADLGGIGGQVSARRLCASFGGTAVKAASNTVFVPCSDGVRAVRIDSSGRMRIRWHAPTSITGSPVIGGGRVWSLNTATGVLHGLGTRSGIPYNRIPVGPVTRFATPAIYGSQLMVPTKNGLVIVRP